jgi:hypothetical protein
MGKEHLVGHQPRHRDDLPARRLGQCLGEAFEPRDAVLGDAEPGEARQELVAGAALKRLGLALDLGEVDLIRIYSDRTLRFCFTNKQMAESINDFVRDQLSQDRNLQTSFSLCSMVSWLDDPFSALDPTRRERIGKVLAGRGQVLVSVADEDHIPDVSEVVWDVSAGTVSQRSA